MSSATPPPASRKVKTNAAPERSFVTRYPPCIPNALSATCRNSGESEATCTGITPRSPASTVTSPISIAPRWPKTCGARSPRTAAISRSGCLDEKRRLVIIDDKMTAGFEIRSLPFFTTADIARKLRLAFLMRPLSLGTLFSSDNSIFAAHPLFRIFLPEL